MAEESRIVDLCLLEVCVRYLNISYDCTMQLRLRGQTHRARMDTYRISGSHHGTTNIEQSLIRTSFSMAS